MNKLFIFGTIILLSGCTLIQQQAMQTRMNAANQKMKIAFEECQEGELTRENALERQDCMSNALRQHNIEIGYPFMWITEKFIAANRESAEEYAEGKINKEQYRTAFERHKADGMQLEAQAMGYAQQIAMQQNEQNLQVIAGMHLFQQPAPAPYMMPTTQSRVINTNCNMLGNNVSCSSYR